MLSQISSTSCEFNNYGIDDREAIYLVNNEAEFNELIGCEYLNVEVDYELHSLLIGRFASYSCGELASQRLRSRCNRTDFEVEIERRDCHAINIITFSAIIPKGFEKEKFNLKVNEK